MVEKTNVTPVLTDHQKPTVWAKEGAIAALRGTRNISQGDLGAKVGMPANRIGMIEAKRARVTPEMARKIAFELRALKVSDLFDFEKPAAVETAPAPETPAVATDEAPKVTE